MLLDFIVLRMDRLFVMCYLGLLWLVGSFHAYVCICLFRMVQFHMGYLPAFDWPIINLHTIALLLLTSLVIQQPLMLYIGIVELSRRRSMQ